MQREKRRRIAGCTVLGQMSKAALIIAAGHSTFPLIGWIFSHSRKLQKNVPNEGGVIAEIP